MQPFNTLTKEALLDALTEYYSNYRKQIDDANEKEFSRCRLGLDAILKELDSRNLNKADRDATQKDDNLMLME